MCFYNWILSRPAMSKAPWPNRCSKWVGRVENNKFPWLVLWLQKKLGWRILDNEEMFYFCWFLSLKWDFVCVFCFSYRNGRAGALRLKNARAFFQKARQHALKACKPPPVIFFADLYIIGRKYIKNKNTSNNFKTQNFQFRPFLPQKAVRGVGISIFPYLFLFYLFTHREWVPWHILAPILYERK